MSKQNFEESLKQLEQMAEKIKAQDTDLETAVRCYEEGMKYYGVCNEILEGARQKIEVQNREEEL